MLCLAVMWLCASVLCLFLTVPRVGLQCVIVEFPGHIHFWISLLVRLAWNTSNEATAMAFPGRLFHSGILRGSIPHC